MEMTSSHVDEWYKLALISLLISACFLITYYFHVILHTEVVFTHFFYVPIIIAAVWWKRRAFIVTTLLSLFLIVSHLFDSTSIPLEDLIRVIMFFFVTVVVVILSEQMEKSNKKLEKSEKKFRAVVESAKEAIITLSDDANVVSWNKAAEKIFGYSEEEILGQSITIIMPEKYKAAFKSAISKYHFSKPMPMEKMVELSAIRKNGEEFPIDISVVNWKVEDGLFFTSIIRDITDRKKTEMALKESEQKFREIAENIEEVFWIMDSITNKIIYISPAFEKIWGVSPDEVYNNPDLWLESIHPADRDKLVTTEIKNLSDISLNMEKGLEYRIKTSNGSIKWIWSRSFAIKGDSGEIVRVAGVASDITALKNIEEELKSSKERFEILFEYAPDAYYLSDMEGNIVDGNKAAEKLSGLNRDEFVGKNIFDLHLISKKLSKATEMLKDSLQGISTGPDEFVLHQKSGEDISVEIITNPVEIKGQKLILGLARDITGRKKMEIDLRNSEEKFREVFNKVNDMITLIEIQENGKAGNYLEVNDVACERLGYSREEMMHMSPGDIGVHGEVKLYQIKELIETGKLTFERTYISKNGDKIPVEINSHIFKFKGNDVALSVARDITDRKEAEKAILASENRYRTLFDISPEFIILISKEGKILDVNDKIMSMSGLQKDKLIGMSLFEVHSIYTKDIPLYEKILVDLDKGNGVDPFETRLIDYAGKIHFLKVYAKNFKLEDQEAILIVATDITFLKEAEKELKLSLNEKEMLLKEIYHRVKNNLMVISSLLSLQSRFIKDKAALDVFKESQNRAKSMALIHEKLYRSTDLKRMDFGEYIRTLTTELFHTYVRDPSKVDLKLNVENVMLDINTAVPLGLILNELVTNSMKHAFPEGKSGEIIVELHLEGDTYSLIVADSGIGFPKDLDFHQTKSLGLQLVNSLTEQIEGEVELDSSHGTKFTITFKEEKYDSEK